MTAMAASHFRLTMGLLSLCAFSGQASAGQFDSQGQYLPDPTAEFFHSFEGDKIADLDCDGSCEIGIGMTELALHGNRYIEVNANQSALGVGVSIPSAGTYEVRVWLRHARAWVRIVAEYEDTPAEATYLFPTGRVTSDGWVELASNPFSHGGPLATRTQLRVSGSGLDLDALEIRRVGPATPMRPCLGARDPVCGSESECIAEFCRDGDRYVPPIPAAEYRASVTGYLRARFTQYFGGKRSRAENLPRALNALDTMKQATTPWQYWSAHSLAVRLLEDWHTNVSSGIAAISSPRRLGVCFIEGVADLTQAAAPSHPSLKDVLVSHVGPDNTLGLVPGDRLVSVDGKHPLQWARELRDVRWRHHVATDPDVNSELAESMRRLLVDYASEFEIIRCDPKTKACSGVETISVTAVPEGGALPRCDNRPQYHLKNPPESSPGALASLHQLPFQPWRELVEDSQPGEDIYGMTWDSLFGTSQGLTPFFLESNAFFKQNARGVILDHRAGSGGTKDAAEAITKLVRPTEVIASGPTFVLVAGDDGPQSLAEGKQRFDVLKNLAGQAFRVGSNAFDSKLPVALILHRDGSASDLLPLGMKGAPNVRIFGHDRTAGAFSSFYRFGYWSRYSLQIASGDSLRSDGTPLIGRGIEPDEIVPHTQTSLLDGQDAPYAAALAWVRSRLK